MRISKLFVLSFFALFVIEALAGEESIIDLKYEPQNSANTKSPPSINLQCGVLIDKPQDMRLNKETLGTTFRDNPIMSKQAATEWLYSALLDMKRFGISASADNQALDAPVLKTELDKLYIWNHSMNLYATVVVKAIVQKGNDVVLSQKYRVIGTKLNWANGDGEFVTTLNIAVNRLLGQLATDIGAKCNS